MSVMLVQGPLWVTSTRVAIIPPAYLWGLWLTFDGIEIQSLIFSLNMKMTLPSYFDSRLTYFMCKGKPRHSQVLAHVFIYWACDFKFQRSTKITHQDSLGYGNHGIRGEMYLCDPLSIRQRQTYFNRNSCRRHRRVLGNVGPLHRSSSSHILEGIKEKCRWTWDCNQRGK